GISGRLAEPQQHRPAVARAGNPDRAGRARDRARHQAVQRRPGSIDTADRDDGQQRAGGPVPNVGGRARTRKGSAASGAALTGRRIVAWTYSRGTKACPPSVTVAQLAVRPDVQAGAPGRGTRCSTAPVPRSRTVNVAALPCAATTSSERPATASAAAGAPSVN